jgi:hypothetical protein
MVMPIFYECMLLVFCEYRVLKLLVNFEKICSDFGTLKVCQLLVQAINALLLRFKGTELFFPN